MAKIYGKIFKSKKVKKLEKLSKNVNLSKYVKKCHNTSNFDKISKNQTITYENVNLLNKLY